MGRTSFLAILLIILLQSHNLSGGEIILNKGKTEVILTSNAFKSLSLSVSVSSVSFRGIETDRGRFYELYVQGFGFGNVSGDPKLPVYHKLIDVPLGASFDVRINSQSYQEFDLRSFSIDGPIIPAQAPLSKHIADSTLVPLIINTATYHDDRLYGGPLVSVVHAGIMRSVNLARVDISPVWYNPVTGKIRVYEKLDISVNYIHPDIPGTVRMKKEAWSPFFSKAYYSMVNYREPDSLITEAPVTYVIIAPPEFHDALQPFIRWKKKKGFNIITGYTGSAEVGNSTWTIKNYLLTLYNNPPEGFRKPSFVLFAGDIGLIPAWNTNGHPSDMYYCDYTGDNIPDVYYGRFAAQTVAQLQTYICKTLEYEQYTMPSDSFLGEATMVAGNDPNYGTIYGNGQINYGTDNYFNPSHGILSHTYLQPEPQGGNYSGNIQQNVSDGVAFANYTAHGSEQGWADPSFQISDIPLLENDHKFCLMVGNCCKTANFATACFAKEVTRASGKGALGYIGCSDYSYWDEDYWWACGFKSVSANPPYDSQHPGAYDGTFHDHGEEPSQWFVTLGQMVVAGQLAVEESGSSIAPYYWETYCLMGDPSLSIYFSVPTPVAASYRGVIPFGSSNIEINTEPFAYVALSVHDTILLGAGTADLTGVINLSLRPPACTDTLSVVITKQNRKPHTGIITIEPLTVEVDALPAIVCKGESAYLTATVAGCAGNYTCHWNPATYLDNPDSLSPVSTPVSDITYTVTVSDGVNNITSSPITVGVKTLPPAPVITFTGCTMTSNTCTGNQWYLNDTLIPGAVKQYLSPFASGNYYDVVTDTTSGCVSPHSNIIIHWMQGVGSYDYDSKAIVFPDPFRDKLSVYCDLKQAGVISLSIYDIYGNIVKVPELSQSGSLQKQNTIVLDTKALHAGFYIVRIRTPQHIILKKILCSN